MQLQGQTPGHPFHYEPGREGKLAGEVLVAFEPGGELMSFDAVDIEPTAMFLVSDHLFGVGEELFVSFESPSGPRVEVRMEVVEVDLGPLAGCASRNVTPLGGGASRWAKRWSAADRVHSAGLVLELLLGAVL